MYSSLLLEQSPRILYNLHKVWICKCLNPLSFCVRHQAGCSNQCIYKWFISACGMCICENERRSEGSAFSTKRSPSIFWCWNDNGIRKLRLVLKSTVAIFADYFTLFQRFLKGKKKKKKDIFICLFFIPKNIFRANIVTLFGGKCLVQKTLIWSHTAYRRTDLIVFIYDM